MDVLEAVETRRSIRSFKREKVDPSLVEKILRLAMCAPSAGNEQPWHFIVLDDEKTKNDMARIHPYAKMLFEAPLGIIVLGDVNLEKYKGFWVQDCSSAIMNILISAPSFGLQTVWCGVYPSEERVKEIKDYFKLPENIIPLGLIVMGYSDKKGFKVERFKPERIHYNIF